jgi:gamma-glutamyltranspeptidase
MGSQTRYVAGAGHVSLSWPRKPTSAGSASVMSFTHPSPRLNGGIAASAYPLTSGVGGEMLRAGESPFDAAVSSMATLNIVEPFMYGLVGLDTVTC